MDKLFDTDKIKEAVEMLKPYSKIERSEDKIIITIIPPNIPPNEALAGEVEKEPGKLVLLNNGDVLQMRIKNNTLHSRVISEMDYALSRAHVGTTYSWDIGYVGEEIEILGYDAVTDSERIGAQRVLVLYRAGKKLRRIGLLITDGIITYYNEGTILEDITKLEK